MDVATGEKEKRADKGESWRSSEESFDWDISTELFQLREVEPRGIFLLLLFLLLSFPRER